MKITHNTTTEWLDCNGCIVQLKILKFFFLAFTLISFSTSAIADSNPLSWSGFAALEDVENFSGGIRKGSVFDAVGHIETTYDAEKAHLWDGGKLTLGFLAISESHNQNLYTGAVQTVSNLSAPNKILISDLLYTQSLNDKVNIYAGIMDTNHHFDIVDYASGLLNSSYGHCPIMTSNYPIATYPYPGFGLILNLDYKPITFQFGIFQGNPQHQSTVFHDGYALYAEITGDLPSPQNIDMNFKFGAWHYQQSNPAIGNTTSGMYVLAQASLHNVNNKLRGVFLRFGAAPESVNIVPYYLGGGYTASAIFDSRPDDVLSIGFSTVWIKDLPAETIFEITYAIQLIENLILNPDLQYVIKPAGIYPNAFAGIIRLTYNF